MDAAARWDLFNQYMKDIKPSPELREQRRWLGRELLKLEPDIEDEVALREARKNLRRVLSRRGLALRPEQEARIDACDDIANVERWLEQAVTAASAEDALT